MERKQQSQQHEKPSHRVGWDARRALRIGCGMGAAAALMLASGGAFALNTGSDADLTAKPAAGGMAGAAFTRPQEPSAAVFGNPATMTQLKGTQFQIGVAYLNPDFNMTQSGAPLLGGAESRTSRSRADEYVIPDTAVTYELGSGWSLGGGIEVGGGLGADFRHDPITVPSVSTDPTITGLPLLVEYLEFRANVAVAKQLTPRTSVGAALTIGAAFAQLGTAGPSGTFAGLLGPAGCVGAGCGFGGTTSSTHDMGVGGTFGITHKLTPGIMLSAAVKTPIRYNFQQILHTTVAPAGFQNLGVEQPLQVMFGAGFDITPNWLVETDVVWKNWSKAATYEDVYKDQYLFLLGNQFKVGPWSLRFGYSYASDLLRNTPNNTLNVLHGLGPIPLGSGAGALGTEVVKLVQLTLVPVIWQHTLATGVGLDISPKVRFDAFGTYAFKNSETRISSIAATATGLPAGPETYEARVGAWMVGAGVNFKF